MATGPITKVSDIIVPAVFTPYVTRRTAEKSALIQSGAVIRSDKLDADLAGGGLTFNMPAIRDLDNDEENISTDEQDDYFTGLHNNSTPKKISTTAEIAVRLSRNQSWSSADLTAALAGYDPMEAIGELVSSYWQRRLQAAFIATIKGVLADNGTAPLGTEHVLNDLSHDITGTAFQDGVTNFGSHAFIDTAASMGDAMGALTLIAVHSVVYARMQKNNLIQFIPDARGELNIPTYMGRVVIVDDAMPHANGIFDSWLFGPGAIQLGLGTPKVPTEVQRHAAAANGGGTEVLYSRVEWAIHPTGHAYVGTPGVGGPTNAATANNLANADSWRRAYTERKQIKIARLRTREF